MHTSKKASGRVSSVRSLNMRQRVREWDSVTKRLSWKENKNMFFFFPQSWKQAVTACTKTIIDGKAFPHLLFQWPINSLQCFGKAANRGSGEQMGRSERWLHCHINSWMPPKKQREKQHRTVVYGRAAVRYCQTQQFMAALSLSRTDPFSNTRDVPA